MSSPEGVLYSVIRTANGDPYSIILKLPNSDCASSGFRVDPQTCVVEGDRSEPLTRDNADHWLGHAVSVSASHHENDVFASAIVIQMQRR